MASSRRTGGAIEHVSVFGAARAYTSLSTWEVDTTYNLVSANKVEVLECYNDQSSYDQQIVIAGATVDSTRFRIIRPASGSGTNGVNFHSGDPSTGVRFFSTAGTVITVEESYCQIQDLVCKTTINNTGTVDAVTINGASVTGIRFVGLLVVDSNNSGSGKCNGLTLSNSAGINGAIDCLFHNNEQHGINVIMQTAGYTSFAYNCTSTNNGAYNIRFAATVATAVAKAVNCIGSDGVSGDYVRAGGAAGTIDVSYCTSKDASAETWGGTGNHNSHTFTFASGTDNFHLASTDVGAMDLGTSLAADGLFAFDDDIDRLVRLGTWDMGFHEYTTGNITVAPGAAAGKSTSVDPTVVLGALALAPAAAESRGAVVAPTVMQGSLSLTPSAASSPASSSGPEIVLGALSISPSAAYSVALAVNPSAVLGSLALGPTAAEGKATSYAPTVVQGSLSLGPVAAASPASSAGPTVVLGAILIAPNAAYAVVMTVDPTVEAGANVTVQPGAASAVILSVAPTIVFGSISATPQAAAAIGRSIAPDVMQSSMIVAPTAAEARISSTDPTVILGVLPQTIYATLILAKARTNFSLKKPGQTFSLKKPDTDFEVFK